MQISGIQMKKYYLNIFKIMFVKQFFDTILIRLFDVKIPLFSNCFLVTKLMAKMYLKHFFSFGYLCSITENQYFFVDSFFETNQN